MKIQFEKKDYKVEYESTIEQFIEENNIEKEYDIIAATFNNEYVNLGKKLTEDGTLDLIDISSKEGNKIYRKTMIYILSMAFEKVFPDKKLAVDYQLTDAMFCRIYDMEITEEIVEQIESEMKRIVVNNYKIEERCITRQEAAELYRNQKTSKGRLQMDIADNHDIFMNFCEDYFSYCYGIIASKTGIAKTFEVIKYGTGFLVRYPNRKNPNSLPHFIETKKIAWALEEYENIHEILNVNKVYQLNKTIENNNIKDVIMVAEALHEKKIAYIADNIAKNREVKMILIAGPSSSGKTTFAQRLGIQLRINGIKPVTISVDNYFVERPDTPRDEFGNYNFESIDAIDVDLFNDHLTKLLNGETVEIPEFNFHIGTKEYKGKKLKLNPDEVLVIEGIHCLNDKLTRSINKKQKYKVYISALTVLNMDRYNRISTSDTRLIRRMVRDNQFRGYNALHTIGNWHMVRKGEEENIFPFQEEADSIFNTSLIYELGVMRNVAIPLLEEIPRSKKEYAEAQRLIEMLKYFRGIPKEYIPSNSLLKEFVGGGDFKY